MKTDTAPATPATSAAPGAIAVRDSGAPKLVDCAATYAAQSTCPASCPFRGRGCYGESGRVGMVTRRLARSGASAKGALAAEVAAIDALPGRGVPLRLHVVGDAPTVAAAVVLGAAARRYRERGGGGVWTYTHAWGEVPRWAWGEAVSVFASCEHAWQVHAARAQGYQGVALVVADHASPRAWESPEAGKVVPCPEQTGRVGGCAACRLCWQERRFVVALAAHGGGRRAVLEVVQ